MAFGISASPLSCECGAVTITASDISTTPSRWGLFLFYKAVYNSTPVTPFYTAPLEGNFLDPESDTYFNVTLPCNALYTFYAFSIEPYNSTYPYGEGDWVFNPVDSKIYISNSDANTGHALDLQIYWRQMDSNDYQDVPSKGDNYSSISFPVVTLRRASLVQDVTCNTKFSGLGVQIKKNLTETSRTCLALTDRTGNFTFDCNPNGYGGVNPKRGNYAFMAILTNTKSDGTFTEIAARPYSYRSSLEYRFDVPRDALYVLNVFMVQLFAVDSSYNVNVVVFEAVSNKFYKSKYNNNTSLVTDTDKWEAISSYASFSAAIVYKTLLYYYVFDVNAQKLLYDLKEGVKTSCPCGCNGSSKCGSDLMKKYAFVLASINNACFAKELGRMAEAQCFLEKIPKNCSPYVSAFKC
jgi:hypothetical protein